MPGDLETYIDLYQEADKAWCKFYTALQDASMNIAHLRANPQLFTQSAFGTWPSYDELRTLFQDAFVKTAPLQAHYGRLPEQYRKRAESPHNLGKEPI
jgi:hypothetical protein